MFEEMNRVFPLNGVVTERYSQPLPGDVFQIQYDASITFIFMRTINHFENKFVILKNWDGLSSHHVGAKDIFPFI